MIPGECFDADTEGYNFMTAHTTMIQNRNSGPKFTAILDRSSPAWKSAMTTWITRTVGCILLIAGIGSAVLHPKPMVAANGLSIADVGNMVILEPPKWIEHRMPVLANIVSETNGNPLGNRLARGQWVVLFYHASCGECQKAIPVYERFAEQTATMHGAFHVAFVRVPSDLATPIPKGLFNSNDGLHGTLDTSRQWFATTPAVVEIENGVVTRTAADTAAMNMNWLK